MSQKTTYTLDLAEGACELWAQQVPALFKRNKKYTLTQVYEAGLSMEAIAWLLAMAVKREGKGFDVIQEWARRCADAVKLRGKHHCYDTVEGCVTVIQTAIKAWAKDRQTAKGGRQWSYSVLEALIREGKF